eukprot:176380-Hanusia_phi.AAC.1
MIPRRRPGPGRSVTFKQPHVQTASARCHGGTVRGGNFEAYPRRGGSSDKFAAGLTPRKPHWAASDGRIGRRRVPAARVGPPGGGPAA